MQTDGRAADAAASRGERVQQLSDGAWSGRRVWIIGGGPSLEEFDWRRLDGELTIGLNKCYQRHWPSVLLSNDERFWELVIEGTEREAFDAVETFTVYAGRRKQPTNLWQHLDRLIPGIRDGWSASLEDGLRVGSETSLLPALNLADVLGARVVYLIGFDMHPDDGDQSWWHDGYPWPSLPASHYCLMQEEIESIAHFPSCRVVNLNPDSGLTAFPKIPKPSGEGGSWSFEDIQAAFSGIGAVRLAAKRAGGRRMSNEALIIGGAIAFTIAVFLLAFFELWRALRGE